MAAELQLLEDFIKSVGFPIFVAVLLLFRVDSMHKDNMHTNRQLARELAALRAHIAGKNNLRRVG
jgi:Tfp pilus assembly protein PilN